MCESKLSGKKWVGLCTLTGDCWADHDVTCSTEIYAHVDMGGVRKTVEKHPPMVELFRAGPHPINVL